MQIFLWRAEREPTELLMTPADTTGKAPPPTTGGAWVRHSTVTRSRHSVEPLPGGVSWEEVNACFSFTGYWTGAGEL